MPTIQERFKTLKNFGSGRQKRIGAILNLTDEDVSALSVNPNAEVSSLSVESGRYRGDYSDQAEYVEGDIVTLNHVGYVLSDPGESIPTPGTGDGAIEAGDEYPAAAAQATAFGKTIAALGRAEDEVFLGYGDYDTNSGPVGIGLLDVADLTAEPTTALAAVQSEQIILFRRLSDGRVLAPAVDARGATGGHYAERSASGAWAERLDRISALALHVFDLVEGPGGVLFACGSAYEGPAESGDSGATIWKSTDDGATWTLDYSIFDANPDESHRFNWLAVVGDTVYARSHQTDGGGAAGETLEWTAAGGWVASAHPLPVNLGPGQSFRDGYVLPGGHWGYSDMRAALRYFDGITATTLHSTVAGFDVGDDGALYYVTANGILKRIAADGDDLASVTLVETGDTGLRGMVVVPGEEVFAFGGDAAHIRVYDLTQRDPWRPLAPDVLDPATGLIAVDVLPTTPIPGVTTPLAFFKLDDMFTLSAGFRFPTVGGTDGYDNGQTCYVTGGEVVLSGDIYRDASVALTANVGVNVGTLDVAFRPPEEVGGVFRQGADIWVGSARPPAYINVASGGSLTFISTLAAVAAADGYFGLVGLRFPITAAE